MRLSASAPSSHDLSLVAFTINIAESNFRHTQEPHEAEWCLMTVEELFEHFYVGPSAALAMKAALDAKLAAAGKPPSK